MDDKRKPRKKAGTILAVVLLLLPVLYVASAGPALTMVPGRIAPQTYWRVYALVEKVVRLPGLTLVDKAFGRYHGWFGAQIAVRTRDDGTTVVIESDNGRANPFFGP